MILKATSNKCRLQTSLSLERRNVIATLQTLKRATTPVARSLFVRLLLAWYGSICERYGSILKRYGSVCTYMNGSVCILPGTAN